MEIPDPLLNVVVTKFTPQKHESYVATLCTHQDVLLVPAEDHTRAVVLQQVATSCPHLQRFLGVTNFKGKKFLVFEYVNVNTVASWTREERLPIERLAAVMEEMGSALSVLHRNCLVHTQVNTHSFYIADRVILGRLEKVQLCRKPSIREKELQWLGTCFVAMLTRIDCSKLLEKDVAEQLALCGNHQSFNGAVRAMITDAFQGYWAGNYTARRRVPIPLRDIDSVSKEEARILLPPPASLGHLKDSKTQRKRTFDLSPPTAPLSPARCEFCSGLPAFSAPCGDRYCCKCFLARVAELTEALETQVTCKRCCTPFTLSFVFQQLLHQSLSQVLLRAHLKQ